MIDIPDLSTKIRRVRQSAQRLAVRKAPSPSVLAEVGGKDITLVIDEGAELNVLNERIAIREDLEVVPTSKIHLTLHSFTTLFCPLMTIRTILKM